MPDFQLLNNVDHQDVRVITDRSAAYGDNVMLVQTYTFEFRNVQAYFPILFQQDKHGSFYPVALFGFEQGENLFLDESGWSASYVPAMLRREPFLIGYQESKEHGEGGKVRVMSLDMDHPRVNKELGEPLFQPLGGRTPFLENAADLLENIYQGIGHTREFIEALMAHDLIEAVTMEITLRDGSRNQLIGFYGIAEEKLEALSGDVLEDFSKRGFLMPLFMALASMANIERLVELKNASVLEQS